MTLSRKTWAKRERLGAKHRQDHNALSQLGSRLDDLESFRGPSKGAVCFSWDDGYDTELFAAEKAEERGQRNTFYITTGLLNQSGRLDDDDVVALHEAGHEIGGHSVNHDNYVNDFTAAERAADLDTHKAYLEDLIGASIQSFAYPYSSRNATTDREVYGRFGNVAAVSDRGRPVLATDTRPFMFFREAWTSARHAAVLASIRLAAEAPVIVAPYTHSPGFNITEAELVEAYDLAYELGVPCVGVSEVFPKGPNLRNPLPDGTFAGWLPVNDCTVVEATLPDGTPGSHAFRVSAEDGSAYVTQPVPCSAGRSYSLSGLARTEANPGSVRLRLRWHDWSGSVVSTDAEPLTEGQGDGEWHRIQLDAVAPADASFVSADLLLVNDTGSADFCHIGWDETRHGSFGG